MPTRGELVAAQAREWLGTPFHPQAAQRGKGADCKGLLWGVARELGFPEAESRYAQVADYDLENKPVPSALLKEGFAALFDRVAFEDRQPGDVLLLKRGGKACHIAIASSEDSAIHAQIDSKPWVKETKLRALLKVWPLDSVWRWRDGC